MTALNTLFPVFFMIGLGFLCRKKGWITPAQKSGANEIVFKILFPFLLVLLMCSAQFHLEQLKVILYVYAALGGTVILGKLLAKKIAPEHSHFSPYLMSCVEGGNVALPLYLSIVGTSSNTVIMDLGGMLMVFMTLPVLVAREKATGASKTAILKSILTNPFTVAVLIGMVLNVTGLYQMAAASAFGNLISGTFDIVTKSIVPMILFIIGYDLHIDQKTVGSIIKLVSVKLVYFTLIIIGFFALFPDLMADKTYMMAPLIYFMCPTGFGLIPIIAPLYKNEDDASFTSAFISMYMIITLIVYTCVVIFIA